MAEQLVAIRTLDRAGALGALEEVRAVVGGGSSLCLDFEHLGRSEPLGMLLFSAALKAYRVQMREERPDIRFRAIGHQGKSYQAHMGFFKMFGLDFGSAPDEAAGSGRYEPIRYLDLQECEREAANEYSDVREIIERRCLGLAGMLVRDDMPDVIETLGYSLREIVRNALEHAGVDGIWYCAQYWPTRDLVELALVDQGVGIRASLARNPNLSLQSDGDALQHAIRPGVSGVAFKGARKQRIDDEWRNSGYGLYMTSRLAGVEGEFFVGSGDAGLTFSRGEAAANAFEFQGTAISMRIRPSKVGSLHDELAKLRQQAITGTREGLQTQQGTASMSSVMLSRKFDRR